MQKKQFNKISFNNFKAFGEKMQKINLKPITLVYGANSIGKSSLVHFMLYLQYMIKTGDTELNDTDIFGDTLDLGGFSRFLHGRDIDKSIQFEIEIDDKDNINNIIEDLFGKHQSKFLVPKIYRTLENLTSVELEKIVDSLYKDEEDDELDNTEESIERKQFILTREMIASRYKHQHIHSFANYAEKNDLKKIQEFFYSVYENNNLPFFTVFKNNNPSKNAETITSLIEMIEADIEFNLIKYKSYVEYFESIQNMKSVIKIEQSRMQTEYSINDKWFFSTENSTYDDSFEFDIKINKNHELFEILSSLLECLNEAKLPDQDNTGQFNGRDKDNLISEKHIFFAEKYEIDENFRFDSIFINLTNNVNNVSHFTEYYSRDGNYLDFNQKEIEKYDKKDVGFWDFSTANSEFMFDGARIMQGVFTLFALQITDFLKYKAVQYIGPMRFYPERVDAYKKKSFIDQKILNSTDSWYYLNENWGLRDTVNEWLSAPDRLKTPYEISFRSSYKIDQNTLDEMLNSSDNTLAEMIKKVDTIKEMVIIDKRNGIDLSSRDLGLGISQIMPILILANHHKNALLCIEQPELHLHPGIQSELADEFIKSYKENNNEFIIETHSEHLLLRIMKRMRHTAEGKIAKNDVLALTPDDVCLLYVDNDGENTFINELELDEDGTLLDPWPNGFFEEGHRERFD